MTKKDLALELAKREHLTDVLAKRLVESLLGIVSNMLEQKKRIEIRGFGVWRVKVYRAKRGRNPRKGIWVSIPERRRVMFKCSKELNKRVNERQESLSIVSGTGEEGDKNG